MIRKWYNRYMEFSRKSTFVFYTMRILEAMVAAIIVALIFNLNRTETLVIILTGGILTPVGYAFSKQKKKK
ncbi:MAG TPA: hypothetical protein PKY29_06445 [Ferruginibacter sp.]|nr:hypothetical protein [Ferruginibacter sp.]HRN79389.1 hypothetical protein [Ferruginibacter sp.]HRO17427.1 hypothetical protein [Ferruginibacter sp.]HRQ20937.1 hypothetical protein [Ferruginibacter sp.]